MTETHNRTEGDINLSAARRNWYAVLEDPDTLHYLQEDAEYFLHQALSTPCLDVLASCEVDGDLATEKVIPEVG